MERLRTAGRGPSVPRLGYRGLLENVLLPLGDAVMGTSFIATLKRWRRLQTLSAEELSALQRRGLQRLLEHATGLAPYYRELGIAAEADPYAWLSKFPILTKKVLRSEGERLLTVPKRGLVAAPSSGSSGFQSTVYLAPDEVSVTQAIQTLWWEWAGYRLGHSILQTGMTPERGFVKGTKDLLLRTTYLNAFGVSEGFMLEKLEEVRQRPHDHFAGYASSLYLFAKTAELHGIDDVRFDSVISWGDKMFPHYRELIERQFRTRVYDTYGCTEGLMIAAQKDKQQYYVMSPHVVLELLDANWQPVAPGKLGRVVVTRLDARAMPLVRYYLGDLAVAGERRAGEPYELAFPLLERIVGRDTDIVRTPKEQFMVVHTFTGIFEFFPQIEQFRVVQRELSGIEIEYIPAPGFHEGVLDGIREKLFDFIEPPFEIRFVPVERIPPTPSGKPQIIQSLLPQPEPER